MDSEAIKKRKWEKHFWERVNKTDTCWLWTGPQQGLGYGQASLNRKPTLVHRMSWKLINGPIPEGLVLDHLCRVRHCVNPEHMEPVTMRENILRGVGRGAINAKKTHCKRGHPLRGYNVVYTIIKKRRIGRHCRECKRKYDREYKRIVAAAKISQQRGK